MASLPASWYEPAEWASATVLFNYHISFEGMLYSVPYEHIKHKVDMWITDKMIENFTNKTETFPTGGCMAEKVSIRPLRIICPRIAVRKVNGKPYVRC